MARSTEDRDKPWVSNYPALLAWLDKHRARCMWQEYDNEHSRRSVEGWLVGDTMVIVLVYADQRGWELFTPCLDTEIAATLADAEKRLGLT